MTHFVLHILKLNLIAGFIILLVKLLSGSLKSRFTAQWKYFVWFMISLILLVPVPCSGDFALFHIKTPVHTETLKDIQDISHISAAADTLADVSSGVLRETPERAGQHDSHPDGGLFSISYDTAARIFLSVWLIGAALRSSCEIFFYCRSLRRLQKMSIPVYQSFTIQAYTHVCRIKGISSPPSLMQNAGLSTPLLAGLFRPRLYLPAKGYTAEELRLIFHHELSHYVRRDLWYKMLLRLCAVIYWFNPFLFLMLKEAENDVENLCDAGVVRRCSSEEHRLYRRLLLKTAALQNRIPYTAASLNDNNMPFKDRILYMQNLRHLKRSLVPGIMVILLLITVNISFVFSTSADNTPSSGYNNTADTVSDPAARETDGGVSPVNTAVNMIPADNTADISPAAADLSSVSPSPDQADDREDTAQNQEDSYSTDDTYENDYTGNTYETGHYDSGDTDYSHETDIYDPAVEDIEDGSNPDTPEQPDSGFTDTGEENTSTEDTSTKDATPEDAGSQTTDRNSIMTEISDPFNLYSWDPGTDSYIPYQQAESDGSPIGRGNGWYYFDAESCTYQPW